MDSTELLASVPRAPALEERRTTSEHVAEALRAAIRSGALPDGSSLNQVALAEHFGVSRVPVREAMRQLQAEGWISARPHHRAVVLALSRERIAESFDLRALLEAHLVEKSIARTSPQHLARLERLCAEMEAAVDHRQWLALNRAFHRELYEPSGATTTIALVDQLGAHVERYVRAHGEDVAREAEAAAEHREILRCVESGRTAQAQRLIRQHVEHTRRRVLATIDARTTPPPAAP